MSVVVKTEYPDELDKLIAESQLELADVEARTVDAYRKEDIVPHLCNSIRRNEFLDLRDPRVASCIIGLEGSMMTDMVDYFLTTSGLKADEKRTWGPPRWTYTKGDAYDSFDYYMISGCPNCNAEFEFGKAHYATVLKPFPALKCLECGHTAAPLHFSNESDAWADRIKGSHIPKTLKDDGLIPVPESHEDPNVTGGLYLRGTRHKYDFGHTTKEWWYNYFLPKKLRNKDLETTLHAITMMSLMKGQRVGEKCELCGNGEAYYHQFQARSADEGSTIMYECTNCHNRKVFNN